MATNREEYARVLPFHRESSTGDKLRGERARQGTKRRQGRITPFLLFRRCLGALLHWFITALSQRGAALMAVMGFFAARGALFGEIAPFGPAFFGMILLVRPQLALPVFLAVLAGTSLLSWNDGLLWLTGGTVTWILLRSRPKALQRLSPRLQITLVFATACIVLSILGVGLPWPWCGAYVLILYATCHLLHPLVETRNLSAGKTLTPEQIIAVLALVVILFLGVAKLQIGPWVPQVSLSLTVLLLMATQWGAGVAAIAGICLGVLVAPALPVSLVSAMGMLGLAGVGTGLGARYGRFGATVGFLASIFLVSMDILELETLQFWWLHGIVGWAVYIVLPTPWVDNWAAVLPGSQASLYRQAKSEARLQREVNSQLSDLAGVFSNLADTFSAVPQARTMELDYGSRLDALSERVCRECPSFDRCWKDSFYLTYWQFMELLTGIEKRGKTDIADLGEELKERCIRPTQLVLNANYLYEMLQVDAHWRQQIEESQEIVAAQLQGVAQVFRSFANTVHVRTEFVEEYEEKLALQFKRAGIDGQVRVRVSSGGRLQVELTGSAALTSPEWNGKIEDIISSVMETQYQLWTRRACDRADKSSNLRRMVYLPKPTYELEIQADAAPRSGGWVNGDTFTSLRLDDGKVAIVLSDGMGSGSKAAMESGTTVKLLSELLSCGFERPFAVKIVNSILRMRNPQDMFTTVDLAIIDVYSGQIEFTKIGAAPSYVIRRDGEVDRIQLNSIPLGILQRVDYQSEVICLEPYDTLVMVTDGIIEAGSRTTGGDEWLLHYLATPVREDHSNLAQSLLAKAQEAENGPQDDQTVITVTLRPLLQPVGQPMSHSRLDIPVIVRSSA